MDFRFSFGYKTMAERRPCLSFNRPCPRFDFLGRPVGILWLQEIPALIFIPGSRMPIIT
jgi:hypothetical protein